MGERVNVFQKLRSKLSTVTGIFFIAVFTVPGVSFFAWRWYENNIEALPYYRDGLISDDKTMSPFVVPDFAFINQDSSLLDERYIKGRICLFNYFFTSCPTICPKIMASMKRVLKTYANDDAVRLVSLTVDPTHDLPSRLKRYSETHQLASSHWNLGTGSKVQLYHFARKGLFITVSDGDGSNSDFIHSEKLALVDPEKHIRGYYDGTDDAEIGQLIKDIKKLELEICSQTSP